MNAIEKLIEGMSEQELQAILNTEYPAELEKQAEAALAQEDLVDALYAYGALMADKEVAESEGELSKEASAEFEAASNEIQGMVDSAIEASGVAADEDTISLNESAQAAAAVILEGYTDQIEKTAAAKAKAGKLQQLKKWVAAKSKAVRESAEEAGKYAKKHKKPLLASAGVGALGALGAMKAKEHMDKRASELTVSELMELLNAEAVEQASVVDGIDKLAAKGREKAAKGFMASLKGAAKSVGKKLEAGKDAAVEHAQAAGKYLKKNVKPIAGGAAAGAALGAGAAHLANKKSEE